MMENSICKNWKPVTGYENYYEVNPEGVVRSKHKLTRGQVMTPRIDRGGYLTVRLNKPGRLSSTQYVHRILALAFIPNPEGKCCVNHLNGNKLDNSLENLAWASHQENVKHAYDMGLIAKPNVKRVVDHCTGQEYESAKEAALFTGIPYNTLRNYLNGGIATNSTCLEFKREAA